MINSAEAELGRDPLCRELLNRGRLVKNENEVRALLGTVAARNDSRPQANRRGDRQSSFGRCTLYTVQHSLCSVIYSTSVHTTAVHICYTQREERPREEMLKEY